MDSWTTSNAGTEYPLYGVAFGDGQFVAVGTGGSILTSPDGVTWTQRNSGTKNRLPAVTFGNSQFVAVGEAGTIVTSQDGVTWTQRSAGTSNYLYAVTYGNRHFVAVGGGNAGDKATIVSSSDGVTWTPWYWTPQDPETVPPAFTGVAYGNGHFVAVFPGAQYATSFTAVATSSDGINWTQGPAQGPQFAGALAFGNGQFVAVGVNYTSANNLLVSHAIIYSSTDGVGWAKRADILGAGGQSGFSGIAYGAGQFVAVGDLVNSTTGKAMAYSSADGINWVGHDLGAALSRISYGNGRFVGVAGSTVMLSGVIGKLGAGLAPGGQFLGTITGVTGQNFAIQSSTILGDWTALTNVTTNTNGIAQFSDPFATTLSRRFYQALLAQP